jgi:ABC-type transport system involved in cytochrome c biogenesis permease component
MSAATHEDDLPVLAEVGRWSRLDSWLERCGERLNPILVKEARQALKSRQFVITFSLLLVCGWAWSLMGVALQMPEIYYSPSGPFMLTGYFVVLTVPLLLIVPFAAYRSLAAEREDGTYELLSITTLSSRQIVTGKLGSAVLQMLVYYSALSPCIAFTYLLRGIDILTIVFTLAYTFMASLLLSAVGLIVAAASRARHVQILLSVVLLMGLAVVTIIWCVYSSVALFEHEMLPFDEDGFWIAQGMILSLYISYVVLFVLAASAQLSFASDNRSTKLRIVMLVQQVLLTGWVLYLWLKWPEDEMFPVFLSFSAVHWMIMGALLTGEWAQLSPRVQRQLPRSFLGRALCTWFNPGSGSGYVFAVVNLVAATLVISAVGLFAQAIGRSGAPRNYSAYLFGALVCAYVAGYLGVGRLLVLGLRRFLNFGLLLPFVIHVLLVLIGMAVPFFLQAWLQGFAIRNDYTVLQVTNWAWTLYQAAENKLGTTPEAPIVILLGSLAIFLVNLVVAAREIEQVRQEAPERVVRDDIELHPERAVQPKPPTSPWDEPA